MDLNSYPDLRPVIVANHVCDCDEGRFGFVVGYCFLPTGGGFGCAEIPSIEFLKQ